MDDFASRLGAALVVGGSGGLGSAIARLLGERGSDVAITYRSNRTAARTVIADIRGARRKASAWQLDLTRPAAAANVVASAAARYGGLHTLVYAAGPHVPMVHLSRVKPADFRRQVEQEAVAFFNVVSPALHWLRQSKGTVVALTTAATSRPVIRDGLSSGPKGAIEAVVRSLAAEEGRYGVRVNIVGPGMLSEGMAVRLMRSGDLDEHALDVARASIPLRHLGTARDIAEAVCFLASDRARYISGQKLNVDGGFSA